MPIHPQASSSLGAGWRSHALSRQHWWPSVVRSFLKLRGICLSITGELKQSIHFKFWGGRMMWDIHLTLFLHYFLPVFQGQSIMPSETQLVIFLLKLNNSNSTLHVTDLVILDMILCYPNCIFCRWFYESYDNICNII